MVGESRYRYSQTTLLWAGPPLLIVSWFALSNFKVFHPRYLAVASPLFLLDYFGAASLDPEVLAEILEGAAEACRAHGIAILGGETA